VLPAGNFDDEVIARQGCRAPEKNNSKAAYLFRYHFKILNIFLTYISHGNLKESRQTSIVPIHCIRLR